MQLLAFFREIPEESDFPEDFSVFLITLRVATSTGTNTQIQDVFTVKLGAINHINIHTICLLSNPGPIVILA